ncbi:rRNA-processing protein bfr2 [Sticta canariensis]|nr:rRNA-processing protein bfr2 [Sticta canariensis]
MAKRKIPKSWTEEIAELDDPAPRDFDPEEHAEDAPENAEDSSNSGDEESQNDARNHYEDVGRSKLRKSDVATLGPQYKGSSISRDDLLTTESESDNRFGSGFSDGNVSSEDKFAGRDEGLSKKEEDNNEFTGLDEGSKVQREDEEEETSSHEELGNEFEQDEDMFSITHGANGENHESQRDDISDSDDDDDDSEMEESDNMSGVGGKASMSSSSISDKYSPSVPSDRAALRQMMAESQKSVIATISAATKADLAKGKAIKQQQSAFDALLNMRIRLQKALIATNSFSLSSTVENSTPLETVHAAESAALNLWTQLDSLRQSLHPPANSKCQKRPFSATLSTSTAELWTRMQTQDSISTAHNRTILAKWSSRLNPPAQLRSSLLTNPSSQMTLPALLDQYLSPQNTTRLIARTRVPRSCAPLQASTRHHSSDANIYDDADFYTLLLRDFVDRRMADPAASSQSITTAPTSSSITSMPDWKAIKRMRRANVDTKASKGRKMRYAVHEKLRDFMVHEDRGNWGERRVEELFGSLLGRQRKAELREGSEEEEDNEEGRREEKGLMLFRR